MGYFQKIDNEPAMDIKRHILPLWAFVLLPLLAVAQKRNDVLFHTACVELEQMDRYWQAKQKMPPFTLRVDPVSGEEWIDFADGNGKRIKGKTGDAELVKVVYASGLPVFPLADTVRVIDVSGKLKVSPVLVNGHYFVVEKQDMRKQQRNNTSDMYVSLPVTSGKYVYLSFTFTNKDLFYCQFDLVNRKPVLHQSRVVPNGAAQDRGKHLE